MDRISTKGQMIDQIDLKGVAHSAFDRSNHNYGTGRMGAIIPMRIDGVYPGDRIKARPEGVVNFEPLAAPLMGTMVMKQESFFIPCHQLWRHAYKFFTGKNGFNEPWPSVTPFHIWETYKKYFHNLVWLSGDTPDNFFNILKELGTFYSSSVTNFGADYTSRLRDQVLTAISNAKSVLASIYESRKMIDLVQPLYYVFDQLGKNPELGEISNKLTHVQESYANINQLRVDFNTLSEIFADFYLRIFNFFHGASSLFDYLGWPCLYDMTFKTLAWNAPAPFDPSVHGDWTLIKYLVRRQIFSSSDDWVMLDNYFSNVPLNFAPFKAYYLVWYWNYRDQLLETDILDPDSDEFLGSAITDNIILYTTMMRQRCWFKDTFTTALTNTGDGNLFVPTSGAPNEINVTYYSQTGDILETSDYESALRAGANLCKINTGDYEYSVPMNYLGGARSVTGVPTVGAKSGFISLDLFDRIKRLRSFVQKRLILGYEVDDVVWSSFLVRMSNTRISIPELLGQGRDTVEMNTVVNNTSTAEQIAGDKTATAWAHGQSSEINYFAEEWGLFMTFVTIMPIQSYAGGMQRLYLKREPFDFMWPEFATMGMDAVYNCELASIGSRSTDEDALKVFGYQGRYYDLKSRLDEEHGRILTDLNYLTFSREWSRTNKPKLNYMFVHCWPRLDGFVIEDPTMDVFRYDFYNAHGWERRLPVPSEYIG